MMVYKHANKHLMFVILKCPWNKAIVIVVLYNLHYCANIIIASVKTLLETVRKYFELSQARRGKWLLFLSYKTSQNLHGSYPSWIYVEQVLSKCHNFELGPERKNGLGKSGILKEKMPAYDVQQEQISKPWSKHHIPENVSH